MIHVKAKTLINGGDSLEDASVLIDGERIHAITHGDDNPPDSGDHAIAGHYVLPGFIDLQLNGGFGHDFTASPESIWEVAAKLTSHGVTSFLPTIITSDAQSTDRAISVLGKGPPGGFVGAQPLGLHFEGPFLNPDKKGAHDASHLRLPNLEEISSWTQANGVRLVTMAPELEGAPDVMKTLIRQGVTVSAGHSMAGFSTAMDAFSSGASYATHLFNAMPPLHHREPGLVGAALARSDVMVGIIPDGVHVHPDLLKLVARIKGRDGVSVVTDAMGAMGMEPGTYTLAGAEVNVDSDSARLSDGTLAGSIITLDNALRNWVEFSEWPLADASLAVTGNPGRLLGGEVGSLTSGGFADVTILDEKLSVCATIVRGKIAYQRKEVD